MQKIIYITVLCSLFLGVLKAQDPHYSQYFNSPLWVNPAKAGQVDGGDIRAIANYKDQWNSVTTSFTTASVSVDGRIPFYEFGEGCSYFGAGLLIISDKAGDGAYQQSMAQLNVAYHQSIGVGAYDRTTYMSMGLMVGAGQRGFDEQKLTFDNQYNGVIFDSNLASGENFTRTSLNYLDISAGLNFIIPFSKSRYSGLTFGLSLYHLNKPNVSFLGNDAEVLKTRFVMNVESVITFLEGDKLAVLPMAVYMNQGPNNELTLGVMTKYTVDDKLALGGGLMYRNNDAIIPVVKLDYKPFAISASYDINISDLSTASSAQGGMEISLIYTPTIFEEMNCGAVFCPTF